MKPLSLARPFQIQSILFLSILALAACGPAQEAEKPAPTAQEEAAAVEEEPAAKPKQAAEEEAPDPYRAERLQLVKRHIAPARFLRDVENREEVLGAMRSVKRHEFVPERLEDEAYRDMPLPIGYGQTISQPSLVAYMTALLEPQPGDKMLEIGTGSGYQAAILAELVDEVYSIEIVEELAASAEERLERLGYENVHTKHGDGYHGWPEHEPYDGIVVTAAASHIPPPLVEQLKPGARMIIPVGPPFQVQQLMMVEKQEDGTVQQRALMPVNFVPFTRQD